MTELSINEIMIVRFLVKRRFPTLILLKEDIM